MAEVEAPKAAPKSERKTETLPPRSETPSTQDQDAASTSPTTPSSVQPPPKPAAATTKPTTRPTVPAVPAVPVIPALPKAGSKDTAPTAADASSAGDKQTAAASNGAPAESQDTATQEANSAAEVKAAEESQPAPAPAPAKPKLWTGLFSKSLAAASTSAAAKTTQTLPNGAAAAAAEASSGTPAVGSFAKSNASSFAEALQAYRASAQDRLAFLEPRGLVNTGNMCYMNSVSFLLPDVEIGLFADKVYSRCCKFSFSAFRFMTSWIK